MPDTHREDPSLLIRCPSCGQRFHVGDDLRDRTVECGACEHRFRINDEVIIRGRKFYPGEHRDPLLNRFQRVPLPLTTTSATETVEYAPAPDPVKVEPIAPQRLIAGVIAVVVMAFMALLLIFGATRGGMLDGMITSKRLLMAVFTCLLALALLAYANPRSRAKALVIGIVCSIGLCVIPFFFTEGSVPLKTDDPEIVESAEEDKGFEEEAGGAKKGLRAIIGTEPLDKEIERFETENLGKTSLGLWVKNLESPHRFLIRDYLDRATGSAEPPHFYPRGDDNYLLVVPGVTIPIRKLAELAKPLGEVIALHEDLSIVEVQIRNENFVEGPIEKLSNRENPAFYDLNKRELESIDVGRIERAVERLAEAEPRIYRTDIARKLIRLLQEEDIDFKESICRALIVWAESPGAAGGAALAEAERLLGSGSPVPEDIMALVVKEQTPGAAEVLDRLWAESPTNWETLYGELGAPAEATLVRRFPSTEGTLRHSAVRLLGKVGGRKSLEVLEEPMDSSDAELSVLVEKAKEAILKRIGS